MTMTTKVCTHCLQSVEDGSHFEYAGRYTCLNAKAATPTSAQHEWHDDGTVTVTYLREGERIGAVTYPSSRDASIESSLRLFPGTSREWLERVHRPMDRRLP